MCLKMYKILSHPGYAFVAKKNSTPITLNDKINFSSTLRFPIVGAVAVNGKLYIDIVLCHTACEIVDFFDHIENVVGGEILLGTKQSAILLFN